MIQWKGLLHRAVGKVNTYRLLYWPRLAMTQSGTWETEVEEIAKHRGTDGDTLRRKSSCPLHIPEAFQGLGWILNQGYVPG